MKFVESILSNNTTDDHCQEFVSQKGLLPLVTILGLPNLPIDFPTSAACQAVAGVCKSILVSRGSCPGLPGTGLLDLGWGRQSRWESVCPPFLKSLSWGSVSTWHPRSFPAGTWSCGTPWKPGRALEGDFHMEAGTLLGVDRNASGTTARSTSRGAVGTLAPMMQLVQQNQRLPSG